MITSDITFPVTWPSEFAAWLGSPAQASEVAKELIILELHQESRISGGKAAELLGLTRPALSHSWRARAFPTFGMTSKSGRARSKPYNSGKRNNTSHDCCVQHNPFDHPG